LTLKDLKSLHAYCTLALGELYTQLFPGLAYKPSSNVSETPNLKMSDKPTH